MKATEQPSLKEIKRSLRDYCKDTGRSPSAVMAELTAELMLSESSDPLHVYGVEYGAELNKALGVGNGP